MSRFKKKRLPESFYELQSNYSLARSDDERIKYLEAMISHIPHGDEFNKVRSHISRRLRDLRAKIKRRVEQRRKVKESRGVNFNEGLPTIGLIGPPNSGKTYLINHYCGTNYKSTNVPFESKNPKFGVAKFEDLKLQFIEVPSNLEPRYVQLLHKADLILITGEPERFKKLLISYRIVVRHEVINETASLSQLWTWLGLIRVYSKGDDSPILMKKGSTVKEFIKNIHSSWINKFRVALVSGPSVKFNNQSVNLTHELKDKDVIEVKLK